MTIECQTIPIDLLSEKRSKEMWTLFKRHYVGITQDVFETDLRKKNQALLLFRNQQLIGFTSQQFCQVESHQVVYSGDIIIIPEARDIGTASFFHHWATTVWNRCDWWCALSSGPRTFRIPFTFFHRVTPNQKKDETTQEIELRHLFARHTYGLQYNQNSGIVKLDNAYQLRESSAEIREDYPQGAFFIESNPGWRNGDELVSLISLHANNWKPVAKRMLNWKSHHV